MSRLDWRRLRFSLRGLLLAFALVAVCLTCYVKLVQRPTLSVRQLTDEQAKGLWLYGASPIVSDHDALHASARFTATYRPQNRPSFYEETHLIDFSSVKAIGSCGVRGGTDASIRASKRVDVEALLAVASKNDLPVSGQVGFTGIVLDHAGNPVSGVTVGLSTGSSFYGVSSRPDGTFLLTTDLPFASIIKGRWRFQVQNSPVQATWLQGGGTWFLGHPRLDVQPGGAYQVEITLPAP